MSKTPKEECFVHTDTESDQTVGLEREGAGQHGTPGGANEQTGDCDGGIAGECKALPPNPRNAAVHVNRGLALEKKGDWDGAIAELREALRPKPHTVNVGASLVLSAQRLAWALPPEDAPPSSWG